LAGGLFLVLLALPSLGAAQGLSNGPLRPCSFHLLPPDRPAECEVAAASANLQESQPTHIPESRPPGPEGGPEKPPRRLEAGLITGGALVGSALNSFLDGPTQSYHFAHEGWFGQNTYAGGADKASHFVTYSLVSKEFANLYTELGFSRGTSILMGLGVAAATGLVTEIGDGTTKYGFSYEDLVMDVLGAGAAALIAYLDADDLVGFRYGFLLPNSGSATCCQVPGLGPDYSNHIYTGDLKLAGLARRLGFGIGPLKYLMLSTTYGPKGYPTGLPELRERQVGIEIGLNFQKILDDVGVRRTTWWGYALHTVFDNIRIPFTSVGMRYDLNHGEWHGPDNGNSYMSR
jgi:hypothetical protein